MVTLIRALARKSRAGLAYASGGPEAVKSLLEMRVWQRRAANEGGLSNDAFFEDFYITSFGLSRSFYDGKSILDIGCGPRGSLEWARNAKLNVGIDPLAHRYRRFSTPSHNMRYVTATAEYLPFPNECFDVVSSLMSLKHMFGIQLAVDEIVRVIAPGGTLLISTHINNRPNRREPTSITWNIIEKFLTRMKPQSGRYIDRATKTDISLEQLLSQPNPANLLNQGSLSAHFIKERTSAAS